MKNREILRRDDTIHRREDVDMTRKWIFEKGYSVTSKAVERKIGERLSLVPNYVGNSTDS